MVLDNKIIRRLVKIGGVALSTVGVFTLMADRSRGAELPLLAGLFILLISHEEREDERSAILKASSAQMALIIGYAVKLLSTNLYDHQVINVQLEAINHFLILVFALALIIYNIRLRLS
jgi:hypothetical protein